MYEQMTHVRAARCWRLPTYSFRDGGASAGLLWRRMGRKPGRIPRVKNDVKAVCQRFYRQKQYDRFAYLADLLNMPRDQYTVEQLLMTAMEHLERLTRYVQDEKADEGSLKRLAEYEQAAMDADGEETASDDSNDGKTASDDSNDGKSEAEGDSLIQLQDPARKDMDAAETTRAVAQASSEQNCSKPSLVFESGC